MTYLKEITKQKFADIDRLLKEGKSDNDIANFLADKYKQSKNSQFVRLQEYHKFKGDSLPSKSAVCPICNKLFSRVDKLNRILKNKKYCSSDCSEEHFRYHKNKKCLRCGNNITNQGTLCSKCSALKRDYVGERNPRYNKGTSAGYIQRIARENVINSGRRIDLCEKCGKMGNPSIHMIIHHKDINRRNNLASNLIVLCSSCHIGVHNNRIKQSKICPGCGLSFGAKKMQIYCSKLCSMRYFRKKNHGNLLNKQRIWSKSKRIPCIDCKKLINYKAKRCISCANRNRFKLLKEKSK